MTVPIYVEGGGNYKDLRIACRKGFTRFFENSGLAEARQKLKIVPCGGRQNAYNRFRSDLAMDNKDAILLVDSEGPVTAPGPWRHLKNRDNWDRPGGATDDQCHLMVQVMETWFLADPEALQGHYGRGFRPQDLPQNSDIERISKDDVQRGLERAAIRTRKGSYKKGRDSFPILEKLDPAKVRRRSSYANRLIEALMS